MRLSISLLVFLCTELVSAQTNGPVQPEFTTFEPVGTTNMVDPFSGDFTYNIPLIQIPGPNGLDYSLSLSYHSGVSPDEDASWVGYGWTLNPGSIIRNKRGFPDDVNFGKMTTYNDVPSNVTVGVTADIDISPEAASLDIIDTAISAGIRWTLEYNSYRNWSSKIVPYAGFNLGLASLNFTLSDGNLYYSAITNPAELLMDAKAIKELKSDRSMKSAIETWSANRGGSRMYNIKPNEFGRQTYFLNQKNTTLPAYEGTSFELSVGLGISLPPIPAGLTLGSLSGFYNIQVPDKEKIQSYCGYLYTHNTTEEILMDYFTEKQYPFTKKDKYLAIPFSNPDEFNITGEGVTGSFRFYNKSPVHFHPETDKNTTVIVQGGVEGFIGPNANAGANLDGEYQELAIAEWYNEDTYRASHDLDESYYIKMSSDLSSSMDFGDDDLQSAELESTGSSFPGSKSFKPTTIGLSEYVNDGERVSRSAYVTWNTIAEMNNKTSGGTAYQRYDRTYELDMSIEDAIGEFIVFDKNGARYVYGLPVYTVHEENLAFSVSLDPDSPEKIIHQNISTAVRKVGEHMDDPYASAFLLTEITSADYVDRTLDGPTDDDLGEYIKFEYERLYGDATKAVSEEDAKTNWYHWRVPFTGLMAEPGDLSDPNDDMGSYMSGYKEVYYLKSITTKTHFAKFNLSDDRSDGLDAYHDNVESASDESVKGTKKLRKLSSIELYAKGYDAAPDQIIQRTYLEYDNSLCKNIPNSDVTGSGKLTLKKVWTEYATVYPSKVSAYTFEYEYPESGAYLAPYADLQDDATYTAEAQNPDYDVYNTDVWGAYQMDGFEKNQHYSNSVQQKPDDSFDPAAYHLKVIQLPTHGQIHIQYEQDDYAYVQDRDAMIMVPISKIYSEDGNEGNDEDWYYLDLEAAGITDPETIGLLRDRILSFFTTGSDVERMYFKFLYNVTGEEGNECHPEFFEGYAVVESVELIEGEIRIKFNKGNGAEGIVPRTLCKEYYNTHLLGRLELDGCEEFEINLESDPENAIYEILDYVSEIDDLLVAGNDEVCKDIVHSMSYLRVPVVSSKKGGGVRVKRLLLWDETMEGEEPLLYGHEYMYKEDDNTSTGVALNEPSTLGKENALVSFLDRNEDYNLIEKLLRGGEKDLQQYEGPIGEYILPGASVGYSKVIVKNIHSGKTNPGFSVSEYFTAREFPFDGFLPALNENAVDFTDIDEEKDPFYFTNLISTAYESSYWVSQGYRFIQNDMHGKIWKQSTYQGDYSTITDLSLASLSTQSEYLYSLPGEFTTVMNNWGEFESRQLGKEMEVVFDSRQLTDVTYDGNLQADLNVLIIPPVPPFVLPTPTFMLYTSVKLDQLNTHVTCKKIKYPSILKSVISYKDGVFDTTTFLVFDPYTGEPIISSTHDSYDKLLLGTATELHQGEYVTYSIPAHYYYQAMGPKSFTDKMVFRKEDGYVINKGYDSALGHFLEFNGELGCTAADLITPGDWVAVLEDGVGTEIYYADTMIGSNFYLDPHPNFVNSETAFDLVNIEIVRTARANQLSNPGTEIVTYGADEQDFEKRYDPTLTQRVQLADELNDLLDAYKSGKSPVTSSIPFPAGLEEGDSCITVSNLDVSIKFFSGTYSDSAVICRPSYSFVSPFSIKTKTRTKRNIEARHPQFEFTISNPNYNPNPNQGQGQHHDGQDTLSPICLCDSTESVQISTLEDVIIDVYAEPTDTIYSTSSSGFPFKFTVENGDESAGKYVEAGNLFCGSATPSTGLLIQDSKLVLYSSASTEDKVDKVCFTFCDSLPAIDSVILQADDIAYTVGGPDLSLMSGDLPPFHLRISSSHLMGGIYSGVAEIYLDEGKYFDFVKVYSENLIADNIQYCVQPPESDGGNGGQGETVTPDECCNTINISGHFAIDSLNGELVYYTDGICLPEILSCFNLCPNIYPEGVLHNVIRASDVVYTSNWVNKEALLNAYYAYVDDHSAYYHNLKGIWRPWFNTSYKEEIKGIYLDADRVYNAGYFNELVLLNHQYLEANLNSGWIPGDELQLITPEGNSVQSENALDIPFSSQYGPYSNLPVFKAGNAAYDEVSYSSLDYGMNYMSGASLSYKEDVLIQHTDIIYGTLTNTCAHSGEYSILVQSEKHCKEDDLAISKSPSPGSPGIPEVCWKEGTMILRPYRLSDHIQNAGMIVSLWVKTSNSDYETELEFADVGGKLPTTDFSAIAKTGDWTLYEVQVDDFGTLAPEENFEPKIHFTNQDESVDFYADDIRIQPFDSQVSCYVYDTRHRLTVTFDDDHFGTYYLYDLEGRLNKKMVETERGIHLLQENYYNTPKFVK